MTNQTTAQYPSLSDYGYSANLQSGLGAAGIQEACQQQYVAEKDQLSRSARKKKFIQDFTDRALETGVAFTLTMSKDGAIHISLPA
jgi:hypothetical protein